MFYILSVVIGILFFVADRLTKMHIASNMVLGHSQDFIPGVIDLVYVHNDGGAWGMLGGYTWLLLSITVVVMLVCIALLLKYGVKNKLMFISIILVLSGGVGNMIDRIFYNGNVVDFLHFVFMPKFPVFNVADCAIVIGAILLVLYFILDMIKENRDKKDVAKAMLQSGTNGED